MSNPLFNIQYGLFVITTNDSGKDRSADGRSLPKGRENDWALGRLWLNWGCEGD